jgi:hypothetical protein
MQSMYYLYHSTLRKPLSYNPTTGEYHPVSSLNRLQVWDYQHQTNIDYMRFLQERFSYMLVKKLPEKMRLQLDSKSKSNLN